MGKNLGAILGGGLLLFAALGLLFFNEQRIDLSTFARTAQAIRAKEINTNPLLEDKLVSATGLITANQLPSDGLFLKPGRYIFIKRIVEAYGWVEEVVQKKIKTKNGPASSEVKYLYAKKWLEKVPDSASFKLIKGHENLSPTIKPGTYKVAEAKVGVYDLDTAMVNFPPLQRLVLTVKKLVSKEGVALVSQRYLFSGRGTINKPLVGDQRISYQVLPAEIEVTIFGKLSGKMIVPYLDQKGNRLYRIFAANRDQAIRELRGINPWAVQAWRLTGGLMLWLGFALLLEPLALLLNFLPGLGAVSHRWYATLTFFLAWFYLLIIVISATLTKNFYWTFLIPSTLLALTIWYLRSQVKK